VVAAALVAAAVDPVGEMAFAEEMAPPGTVADAVAGVVGASVVEVGGTAIAVVEDIVTMEAIVIVVQHAGVDVVMLTREGECSTFNVKHESLKMLRVSSLHLSQPHLQSGTKCSFRYRHSLDK
jgi:hypothetical protein